MLNGRKVKRTDVLYKAGVTSAVPTQLLTADRNRLAFWVTIVGNTEITSGVAQVLVGVKKDDGTTQNLGCVTGQNGSQYFSLERYGDDIQDEVYIVSPSGTGWFTAAGSLVARELEGE